MANPKPAKPIPGKPPPKQWLTSAITSHDDFSNSLGSPKRVKDDGSLGLGAVGKTYTVIQYKGKQGWKLYIMLDGINADLISPDGSQVIGLTVPVGPVEPDVLTPELNTAAANPLTGLNAIGHFFNLLGEQNTWVRIAEFLGGLVLIAISADIALQGVKNTGVGRAVKSTTKVAKYVK